MRFVVLLILLASRAFAESSPSPANAPGQPVDMVPGEASYFGQTLIIDGAAITLAVVSGGSAPVLGLATLTYLIGPPVVHALHGHRGRVAASVGLRIGLPAAAVLGYVAVESRCK